MTTDITELTQSLKAAATNVKETAHIARYLKATIARQTFKELMTPDNILALVEALEKAQATEAHCNRGWIEAHEQEARAEAAEQRIAELESRTVKLPLPSCTYADHSYPAYSKRQVISLLESLGITVVEGDV